MEYAPASRSPKRPSRSSSSAGDDIFPFHFSVFHYKVCAGIFTPYGSSAANPSDGEDDEIVMHVSSVTNIEE